MADELPAIWHHPHRPEWDCVVCREPWPCAPAKVNLAEEYVNDRVSLIVYLSVQMLDALNDGREPSESVTVDLFDRFVGWAPGIGRTQCERLR